MNAIGIDIGRVIIKGDEPGGDTSFIGGGLDDVLQTPPVAGAFEAIRRIVVLFESRVWLVSKVGERMEEKTRIWLAHYRFHDATGVPADHVRFCRARPQKADHARELGLTYFVDDRVPVLQHLRACVPHLFLFGPQARPAPEWLTPVLTWPDALEGIVQRMNRAGTCSESQTLSLPR